MTRGSTFSIEPPLDDPKSAFQKKKDKKGDESSNKFQSDKVESFNITQDNKGERFKQETNSDSEWDNKRERGEPGNTMGDITKMIMEEYRMRIRDDNGPSIMIPKIPAIVDFELKGHILNMLKDITFFGKNHDVVYKNIKEVLEIENYFNVPNVSKRFQKISHLNYIIHHSST